MLRSINAHITCNNCPVLSSSFSPAAMSATASLFHTEKLWEMLNQVSREHADISPNCRGSLNFDYTAEEQRGLCWREKVICDKCAYRSQAFNLYTEIYTGKRGRKAATAYVGLHVALTQTSIGPNSVRRLCLGSNIPAPSRNAMYNTAIKVCENIGQINTADMRKRRLR